MNEEGSYAPNRKFQRTGHDTRTLVEGNNCTIGTEGQNNDNQP
jgi:hypothetical protein